MHAYKTLQQVALDLKNLENPIPVAEILNGTPDRLALGLDFGLNCGFAFAIYSNSRKRWYMFPHMIGVLDLSAGRYESKSTSFLLFRQFLSLANPSVIFYEDVKFTPPAELYSSTSEIVARVASASELLSSFRAVALLWAEDHNIPFIGIPIGTIKRIATGSGRANKAAMIQACNKQFGTTLEEGAPGSDNAADAAFILYAGLLNYNDGLNPPPK